MVPCFQTRIRREQYNVLSDDPELLKFLYQCRTQDIPSDSCSVNELIQNISVNAHQNPIEYGLSELPDTEEVQTARAALWRRWAITQSRIRLLSNLNLRHVGQDDSTHEHRISSSPIPSGGREANLDEMVQGLEPAGERSQAFTLIRDRFRCPFTGLEDDYVQVYCVYSLLDIMPNDTSSSPEILRANEKITKLRKARHLIPKSRESTDIRTLVTLSKQLAASHRRAELGLRPIKVAGSITKSYLLQIVFFRNGSDFETQADNPYFCQPENSDLQIIAAAGENYDEVLARNGETAKVVTDHEEKLPLVPFALWQKIWEVQRRRAKIYFDGSAAKSCFILRLNASCRNESNPEASGTLNTESGNIASPMNSTSCFGLSIS